MNQIIARQIAELLNSENQLVVVYTEKKITDNKNNFIFEANDNDEVLSCVECKKVQWYQFEICHLTVNPKYRRNGHARSILSKAIKYAKANSGRIIQCTIRKDNIASSSLFSDNGFIRTSSFYYPNSGNDVGVWQKVISERS